MASEYQLKLWTMSVALYEESDRVGVPLHKRDVVTRDAWRKAAQRAMKEQVAS